MANAGEIDKWRVQMLRELCRCAPDLAQAVLAGHLSLHDAEAKLRCRARAGRR